MDGRFERLAEPFEDRAAYKDVRLGKRQFTCIDAYHVLVRLTKVFGLMGEGWGLDVSEFRETGEGVAAIGHLWYVSDGARREVLAVGDGVALSGNMAEAYKKALTNMMSKAASYLGVGLSVYQGRGLDDPYLDRAAEAGGEVADAPPPVQPLATEADWSRIREAREAHGLTQEQVRAILEGAPFCVAGNPRHLLKVHVPALVRRIAESGENRPVPAEAEA